MTKMEFLITSAIQGNHPAMPNIYRPAQREIIESSDTACERALERARKLEAVARAAQHLADCLGKDASGIVEDCDTPARAELERLLADLEKF